MALLLLIATINLTESLAELILRDKDVALLSENNSHNTNKK